MNYQGRYIYTTICCRNVVLIHCVVIYGLVTFSLLLFCELFLGLILFWQVVASFLCFFFFKGDLFFVVFTMDLSYISSSRSDT